MKNKCGHFQGCDLYVKVQVVAPLEAAAHFSDKFWLTEFSFTFVVSGGLLGCITLAAKVWNLLSFMEYNVIPFRHLVLNITGVKLYIQCQDIEFSFLICKQVK